MSRSRMYQVLLIAGMAVLSWLGMMAVHELGHVLGAFVTGGEVLQVVLHPLAFSRTDVSPNPSPLIVVWSGPLVGVIVPLIFALIASRFVPRIAYLFVVFAGFCLLANGAYIGLGTIEGVGDAGDMIRHGSPRWLLIAFGAASAIPGMYLWHRASPRFGFGPSPEPVNALHAQIVCVVAGVTLLLAFAFGECNCDQDPEIEVNGAGVTQHHACVLCAITADDRHTPPFGMVCGARFKR